jgi:hypothetical protein
MPATLLQGGSAVSQDVRSRPPEGWQLSASPLEISPVSNPTTLPTFRYGTVSRLPAGARGGWWCRAAGPAGRCSSVRGPCRCRPFVFSRLLFTYRPGLQPPRALRNQCIATYLLRAAAEHPWPDTSSPRAAPRPAGSAWNRRDLFRPAAHGLWPTCPIRHRSRAPREGRRGPGGRTERSERLGSICRHVRRSQQVAAVRPSERIAVVMKKRCAAFA